MALIAVIPVLMQGSGGLGSMVIGGTSLLIVVAVAIDSMKQIEGQLTMRDYEGF